VLLYVPSDIPEPNEQGYQQAVEHAIVELCQATEGRALVLFTSISQLRSTYYDVRHELERSGLVLLGQGIDGSRRHLLDTFRTSEKAVLFGTRSFWEGVDVVGAALSCLIIARLPFAVPTDPVFYARAKTFEDPFNQYQVPDAILRLRQGFGRLIRSKDDYGVVAVLDRRLLTKRYGATMLRSLPACTARKGPAASLPGVARAWLDPALRAKNNGAGHS
jgi:DNA polymerase III subunit epsilon